MRCSRVISEIKSKISVMKSLISGMVVVAVMMALLLPAVSSAQALEECQDPPGNNEIAALIVKAVEAVRPILSNGIPELGIPPLDPLGPLPNIAFHIDVPRLRMDGLLNETVVRHISEFIICQLNFTLGITEKLELDIRLEDFRIDGYYDVDGLALSLFPVFGNGNFSLDVYEAAVGGGAKISYNPLSDHASIKDLHLDINFDRLVLVMECILGCGDMSDLINGLIDEIAPVVFDAVWGVIDPILTSALENGINDILKNISISDIITLTQTKEKDIGNGNGFVDLVMESVDSHIVSSGMDPGPVPNATLNFGLGTAALYGGQLSGLSTMHRDGLATIDKVADWVFLYANVAVENLQMEYDAVVKATSEVSGVQISANVERVALYLVARYDLYTNTADIDQFIITEFGKIDVNIEGLGVLGYVLEPLADVVTNLIHENVANILETTGKEYLQEALNETPWP